MKTLTTTIILSFIVLGSMGQSKPNKVKKYTDTTKSNFLNDGTGYRALPAETHYLYSDLAIKPVTFRWVSIQSPNKIILTMDRYPSSYDKDIESITIHVKRSNTVWLNDSTLVVKP